MSDTPSAAEGNTGDTGTVPVASPPPLLLDQAYLDSLKGNDNTDELREIRMLMVVGISILAVVLLVVCVTVCYVARNESRRRRVHRRLAQLSETNMNDESDYEEE